MKMANEPTRPSENYVQERRTTSKSYCQSAWNKIGIQIVMICALI